MGAPDFWSDSEHAAAVSSEHARASRRLEDFNELARDGRFGVVVGNDRGFKSFVVLWVFQASDHCLSG